MILGTSGTGKAFGPERELSSCPCCGAELWVYPTGVIRFSEKPIYQQGDYCWDSMYISCERCGFRTDAFTDLLNYIRANNLVRIS